MKNTYRHIKAFILLAFCVLFDQLTKYLAHTYLRPVGRISLIPGILDLQYLENRGAAFGMLANRQWIFILFAVIIAAGCILYWFRLPLTGTYFPMHLCLLFLCAGALGNMIDRIARGFVVDFIYFSAVRFPVFNVADIYVTVSVAAMLALVLFFYKEPDKAV